MSSAGANAAAPLPNTVVGASNGNTVAAAAPNAPAPNAPAPKTPNAPAPSTAMGKWLQMLGVITVESGLGFSAGWSMGKNQIGPIIATLVLISIVFALEFWMRYGYGDTPGWALPGGIFALVAASVVPYMTMSRAGKGKAKDTATFIPTVFAVWATVAIMFGMAVAKSGSRADALQGIILSLLYAAVTAAGGFSVAKGGAAAASTGVFAGMMWLALLIFDMAGLARGPATNSK